MLVQRQHYSRMRNACSPTVRRGGACYILEGVVILKAKRPVAASVSGSVTIKSIIHVDAPPDAWILGWDLILKCHNAFQWILTLPWRWHSTATRCGYSIRGSVLGGVSLGVLYLGGGAILKGMPSLDRGARGSDIMEPPPLNRMKHRQVLKHYLAPYFAGGIK